MLTSVSSAPNSHLRSPATRSSNGYAGCTTSPPRIGQQRTCNNVFLRESRGYDGSHLADNTTTAGREALARGSLYWCDDHETDPHGVACFGPTGRECLIGLQSRFELIDIDLQLWTGVGYVFAICAVLRALTWLRLVLIMQRSFRSGVNASVGAHKKTESTALLAEPRSAYNQSSV